MVGFIFLKAFLGAIFDFIAATWKLQYSKMIASFTSALIILDENKSLILFSSLYDKVTIIFNDFWDFSF